MRPDSKGFEGDLEQLRMQSIPQKRAYSLQPKDDGIVMTLMKEGCRDAGIDFDDPGTADQYYFEDRQMLVVDLGGVQNAD